jgi:O-antigen/teichoic acid export membrane protein
MLAFLGRRRLRSAAAEDHVGLRRIAGYATAILVVNAAYTLFQQVDVLIIGAVLSASAAGLFQAPLRFVALLHYPGYALAGGVAPRLAADRAEGPRVDAFIWATRYTTLFQAALLAPVVVWADPIVDLLLGSDYAGSAEVLRALAPYVFMTGLAPLVSLSVNFLGQAGRRVPIAIATVLVNIGIDLVLIPEIGIVGGAIGTDVAYAIYVPAQLWVCLRVLGVPFRPILVTICRALVAAAGMAGVLALFGTSRDVGVPALILGALAGAIVYLALLVLTRELTLAELRAAPGAVLRRLRRTSA